MDYNMTCPPLDDSNYMLNPSFGDGCCTLGTILAFSVPPALSISLCFGVFFCFRLDSSKWKCNITPGFFLVWVCCLVGFLCIFFSTAFDGISLHTRYIQTSGIVCDTKIEEYACHLVDSNNCYKLWIWLAYFRDNELAFALDRTYIYTSLDRITNKINLLNNSSTIPIWYDPLLQNVITIDFFWSRGTKLGLFSCGLALVGLAVVTFCMLYFEVRPWLFSIKQEDEVEMVTVDE
jgi:hypothetical protein